jgi:hypothetical protein
VAPPPPARCLSCGGASASAPRSPPVPGWPATLASWLAEATHDAARASAAATVALMLPACSPSGSPAVAKSSALAVSAFAFASMAAAASTPWSQVSHRQSGVQPTVRSGRPTEPTAYGSSRSVRASTTQTTRSAVGVTA